MGDKTTRRELDALAAAFAREKALREELASAVEDTRRAIREAKDAGASWTEIGRAMGVSEKTAFTRLNTTREGVRTAFRGEGDPVAKRRKRSRPEGSAGVLDAARALGVSKQTVYNMLADGRLTDWYDEAGHRWIPLPQDVLDRLG